MGSTQGRCPLANATTYQLLGKKMLLLYERMRFCHTTDRDNLVAYPDCAGSQSASSDSDWQDAIRAKAEIEVFP